MLKNRTWFKLLDVIGKMRKSEIHKIPGNFNASTDLPRIAHKYERPSWFQHYAPICSVWSILCKPAEQDWWLRICTAHLSLLDEHSKAFADPAAPTLAKGAYHHKKEIGCKFLLPYLQLDFKIWDSIVGTLCLHAPQISYIDSYWAPRKAIQITPYQAQQYASIHVNISHENILTNIYIIFGNNTLKLQ